MRMLKILSLAAIMVAAPVLAQEDRPSLLINEHKEVMVTEATAPVYEAFRYAPAVRAGDMLYLSGVVAEQRAGEADAAAAYERAFAEIEEILAASGASWTNVVDVTSYHTDFDADFLGFWAFKEDRVPSPYPAWTAIGVSQLFAATGGRAVVEIKVTAFVGGREDNAGK